MTKLHHMMITFEKVGLSLSILTQNDVDIGAEPMDKLLLVGLKVLDGNCLHQYLIYIKLVNSYIGKEAKKKEDHSKFEDGLGLTKILKFTKMIDAVSRISWVIRKAIKNR